MRRNVGQQSIGGPQLRCLEKVLLRTALSSGSHLQRKGGIGDQRQHMTRCLLDVTASIQQARHAVDYRSPAAPGRGTDDRPGGRHRFEHDVAVRLVRAGSATVS